MIRRVLPVLCLVLACLAQTAAADPAAVPLRDSVPHITTVGGASAEVVPDQADIRLGISNERPTADAAASPTAAPAAAGGAAEIRALRLCHRAQDGGGGAGGV